MRKDYSRSDALRVNHEATAETGSYGMARKRFCKHGHDLYDQSNYRFTSDGRRICLACRRTP